VVGEIAKEELITSPDSTVALIKRAIGDDNFVSTCCFPEEPSVVSSYILKKLVKDANAELMLEGDAAINDVVITCPAYFGTKERMQTKQAGILAGLNVLSIINEPTAAAISYGMNLKENKVILVYDLGGGTFDITMIEVKDGRIKVIATGGDHKLGGADWDEKIAEYLASEFKIATGVQDDLMAHAETKNNLLSLAEKAKINLTSRSSHKSRVIYGTVIHPVELTRETFDEQTITLLDQTISLTREMLDIAKGKGYTKYDKVLLVGGSSKMPQVKERLDIELNCNAQLFDPNQSVAKGAAIYARDMKTWDEAAKEDSPLVHDFKEDGPHIGGPSGIITNVLSKTYGMGVINDKIYNMAFAQAELPLTVSAGYETVSNGQTGVYLEIFESEFLPRKNTNGEYIYQTVDRRDGILVTDDSKKQLLEFPRPLSKGTPFDVQFSFDAEGLLEVYAYEPQTKSSKRFNIKVKGVLSPEELNNLAGTLAPRPVE
jgi:molecular chaperone DnaK (HSP70)